MDGGEIGGSLGRGHREPLGRIEVAFEQAARGAVGARHGPHGGPLPGARDPGEAERAVGGERLEGGGGEGGVRVELGRGGGDGLERLRRDLAGAGGGGGHRAGLPSGSASRSGSSGPASSPASRAATTSGPIMRAVASQSPRSAP